MGLFHRSDTALGDDNCNMDDAAMIREGYRDIMTLFGWPVGWAVILMLPILLPLVWWDEHITQPRYARKMAARACKHCGAIEADHEPSGCCGNGGGSTFEATQ